MNPVRALAIGLAASLALAAAPSAWAHRIHSALTEVRPNENTGELEVAHRVFFHDLEVALIESGMDDDTAPLGEDWLNAAGSYAQDRFDIDVAGASLQLDYVGAEIDGQFAWIYFVAPMPDQYDAVSIDNRLLIDLAWNSSRLEGNTYSLLDTRRLIEFGEEATGRDHIEAQMILNHKDAIEFLVGSAEEIDFNRYTLLNLHALLSNNLLADPSASGRLRYVAVGIDQSVFHPLEVPQLIEESFDQLLQKASAIEDPFEQAFFVMVHLPYLQPFDDVNKRVSRLAANIPLIRKNLAPLSFTDVSQRAYTDAILGVYELNDHSLLRDVFFWAYERSAARYAAVRQSLGEPDPFRLKYRAEVREIVAMLIREKVGRKQVGTEVSAWASSRVEPEDRDRFTEIVEDELIGMHEGNFARYQVRPLEFRAWQDVWGSK